MRAKPALSLRPWPEPGALPPKLTFALALALPTFTTGCRPSGDGAVACGQLEPRNEGEVALCNDLEQAVLANVAMPDGEPPPGGWPGVVLLHGSGGLFLADDKQYPCSETLQDQFRIWAELLNQRGYAVVMPDSFYSRGFCDWEEKSTVPRKLDDQERLVVRTFDAAAAANYLCDDPRIDCSRLAVLGFSNGATIAMMLLHDQLSDAADGRLHSLEGVPSFVGAVAYYPGCGLEGELANRLAESEVDDYYYPQAPIWVPHAEKDKLLDTCEELRDPQVDVIADEQHANEDMFEIEVYAGAKHGFDVWFTGDSQADLDARIDAQAKTLAKLNDWF
jgi:dienelactone hydrolase